MCVYVKREEKIMSMEDKKCVRGGGRRVIQKHVRGNEKKIVKLRK